MTKGKELSEDVVVKLRFKVKRELYDRIVEQAKKEKLPGTIEDVLTNSCINWFKGWEKIFAQGEVALIEAEKSNLIGLDGNPLIAQPGGDG